MKRPMTPRGYAALRKELTHLKSLRPELSRAIEVARAHGDLSENGDYDAAKEKSGMTEAKIRDIETKLTHAQIIDPTKLGEITRVVFGVSVRLTDINNDAQRVVTLVGADESNIERGLISIESPFGAALVGKEEGDVAKVAAPGGVREYEINEIFIEPEKFLDPDSEQAVE
jgi:transcription elongation factor GreA